MKKKIPKRNKYEQLNARDAHHRQCPISSATMDALVGIGKVLKYKSEFKDSIDTELQVGSDDQLSWYSVQTINQQLHHQSHCQHCLQ